MQQQQQQQHLLSLILTSLAFASIDKIPLSSNIHTLSSLLFSFLLSGLAPGHRFVNDVALFYDVCINLMERHDGHSWLITSPIE